MSSTFRELGVDAALSRQLDELGITEPFPIQRLTLPDALAGRDVCGQAPTGSGKTLAFSLPVVARVGTATPGRPRALLLVPTRELASQVADTLRPLAQVRRRRVATVFGGTDIRRDVRRLRQGVDILVACPGRLADLVQRGEVRLDDVDLVVVDEADRMADMGFLPVVRRLLDATRADRQTLLFSATLDGDVDVLIRRYQRAPARHGVRMEPEQRADVRHLFWPAERPMRRKVTADVVRSLAPAIVFTRTRRGADRLARQLAQDGIRTAAIHGDRTQRQRERALAGFSAGDITTLVATDVAARGIHVDDVAVVVHYDLPADHKDYVHRSGRTGRAGADGVVVAFVGEEEHRDADKMQLALDLPRGLHHVDLELLTAEDLPRPTLHLPARRNAPTGRPGKGRPGARRHGGTRGERQHGGTRGERQHGGTRGERQQGGPRGERQPGGPRGGERQQGGPRGERQPGGPRGGARARSRRTAR